MALEILWTDFAKQKLKKIHHYFVVHIGIGTAEKIVGGILQSTKKLSDYPESGSLESYKLHESFQIRSVKSRKYKIYYTRKDQAIIF